MGTKCEDKLEALVNAPKGAISEDANNQSGQDDLFHGRQSASSNSYPCPCPIDSWEKTTMLKGMKVTYGFWRHGLPLTKADVTTVTSESPTCKKQRLTLVPHFLGGHVCHLVTG